jgi:hypothetical protein
MLDSPQEVELVVEDYAITGSCAATVDHTFDTDVDGFSLNTTQGVSPGTTASGFGYCLGGLDVSLTQDADATAEVRHGIVAGEDLAGCSLEATVVLVSDTRCGFAAGLQLYPGTGASGTTQFSPEVVLEPGVPEELSFALTAVTTAGSDASYGVTFYRGDLSCE